MTDIPFTGTTPAEQEANKVMHAIVFDVALEAAKKVAIGYVPFLGWPVINSVFNFIVDKLMSLMYDELAQVITFSVIDTKIGAEKTDYVTARDALKFELLKPKETQDEAAIKKASDEFNARLRDLVKFPRS